MTDNAIPPCGPERDRLVAEAVGWNTRLTIRGEEPRAFEDGHGFRYPSSYDPDALAALEAWKAADYTRWIKTHWWSGLNVGGVSVVLCDDDGEPLNSHAPSLRDAATAALVRWRNERSGT